MEIVSQQVEMKVPLFWWLRLKMERPRFPLVKIPPLRVNLRTRFSFL
jgi:hypothetical protein